MMSYRALRFLRHQGIFIGVLFGVALTAAVIAATVVSLSRPQTEARPQIVERVVVVTATPAMAPVGVVASATPALATIAPTAVPPTAAPIPTTPPPPTSNPVQIASAGTTLKFGETWVGQGLNLTLLQLKRQPYGGSGFVCFDFLMENRSGSDLNFEVPASNFYLELSTGKKAIGGSDMIPFNDLGSGSKRQFERCVRNEQIGWDEFQTAKRNPDVAFYVIGVNNFNPRLPAARWRDEVTH